MAADRTDAVFPFWWWDGLRKSGGSTPRLKRIERLQRDLGNILDAARAVHERDQQAQARRLISAPRFKRLIAACRSICFPRCRALATPAKRRIEGKLLLYRVHELEAAWLAARGVPRDYERLVEEIRDEFSLSLAWDPFIRICVWFDAPNISASVREGDNDVPILPIIFAEERLAAKAILEGHENDGIGRRALLFCRKFQELRRMTAGMTRPQRSSFREERRKVVAAYFRRNPTATYISAWDWYVSNGPPADRGVDFEAFRRTVRQGPRRRTSRQVLESLTQSGDDYLSSSRGRARARKEKQGR